MSYEQQGKFAEALAMMRQVMGEGGENPIGRCVPAHIMATSGQPTLARQAPAQLPAWRQHAYLPPQLIAVVHAALGEPE